MEIIDNAVLPQSYHHLELIRYLLILSFVLFLSYSSLLIGTLGFSLWMDRKVSNTNDTGLSFLSKKIIDFITVTKTLPLALGLIPLASIFFGYAQLIQNNSGLILSGLIYTTLFFVTGAFFTYKYKMQLHYKDILTHSLETKDENISQSVQKLLSETVHYRSYGNYAFAFLALSLIFFFGSINESLLGADINPDKNIFTLFVNAGSWLNFFLFLSYTYALSVTVIFYILKKNGESVIIEKHIDTIIKPLFGRGIISIIIALVILTISMYSLPEQSINALSFVMYLISVLVAIIPLNIFYFMAKKMTFRFSGYAFYSLLILLISFVVKDNVAFETSARTHFFAIAKQYEKYQNELLSTMGVTTVEINGEDIYNGKCIACHQFEQRVVGPAYNDVLPKYEGKIDELAKYILNPQKVNPDFPPMPNQGLKPNEAKAIAEYIISVFKEKKG